MKLHTDPVTGWTFVAVIALAMVFPRGAPADEFQDFTSAKNAFEAGEYQIAASRFEQLLAKAPNNRALVQEAHKLLAVSYLFVGDKERAEDQFVALLTMEPGFTIDPLLFPIDVLDFFSDVKNKYAERLAALSVARAEEEAKRAKEEEERRKRELEELRVNVYLGMDRKEHSLLVALMPLGAGQFQNGHPVKGTCFLVGELLLGATALTTFVLHENLRERSTKPFESADDRREYEGLEKSYRVANRVTLGTLGVAAVVGIIDSVYYFKREQVTWRPLDEDEVPKNVRPKKSAAVVAPMFSGDTVGISAVGFF